LEFEFSAGVLVFRRVGGHLEFLFLEREQNWLDTPKGGVENGENSKTAAQRELEEETGLSIPIDPYFSYSIQYFYVLEGKKIKKQVKYFLAEANSKAKVKISSEHVGHSWVALSDIDKRVSFQNVKNAVSAAAEYVDKREKLAHINSEYSKLPSGSKTWNLSRRLVPGEGPANAKMFILGQAPGQKEDAGGRPFIGRAGELLDHLIRLAGMKRESVYITSVVQFFPPENRLPTKDEVHLCARYLEEQVETIKPGLIIALGNLASEAAIGTGKIKSNHGNVVHSKRFGCSVFVTLHPAAAVRIKTNLPIIEGDFRKLKDIIKSSDY
jgi:DNA polymerase